MSDALAQLRDACALIAGRARHVSVAEAEIERYGASLPPEMAPPAPDASAHLVTGTREELAAFWLTLDTINFGSGWFPTLRKQRGRSGYLTIATGVRTRFAEFGPWSAPELERIGPDEVAAALHQHPDHQLMVLFAASLRDLGSHLRREYGGSFAAVVDSAQCSATALVAILAGWSCFADTSIYDGLAVPFLKRAQIAASDLAIARVADFDDLDRLTMFADNLVPHVLRLDGVLRFEPALVRQIERGELIEHSSEEEIEIRACAVHAVEMLAARTGRPAAELDRVLWQRGQAPGYKMHPRHRARTTAY